MTEAQRKLTAIMILSENFGAKMSAELQKFWMLCLKEHSASIVEHACKRVIETYTFKTMPPFAVLQKEINSITGNTEEDKKLEAESAWETVLALVSKHGRYNQPVITGPSADALRTVGGWNALCSCLEDNLKWMKRDFVESYLVNDKVIANALECSHLLALGGGNEKC